MILMKRYTLKETLLFGLTSGLTKEVTLTTNEAKHPFKLGRSSRGQRKMARNIVSTKAGQEMYICSKGGGGRGKDKKRRRRRKKKRHGEAQAG